MEIWSYSSGKGTLLSLCLQSARLSATSSSVADLRSTLSEKLFTHTTYAHHLSNPFGGALPPFLFLYSLTASLSVLLCLATFMSHSSLAVRMS